MAATDFELVEEVLTEYGEIVRRRLLRLIPTREPRQHLYDLISEYPRRGGRMLRPSLCLASAGAFGAPREEALPSAVALELLHNAFLIHDDIEDESLLRRGAATLNAAHGTALALNAGDGMLMLAMQALQHNGPVLGASATALVFDEALRMIKMTVEGQALDISLRCEGGRHCQVRDYFDIILKKTSWYTILFPIRVGALIGRRRTCAQQRFFRFALCVGAVFQIMDDVMNLESRVEEYGKELAGDLYEGKPTLMLLYLLEEAEPELRARIDRFLRAKRSERLAEEAEWLRQLLIERGCIDKARAVARALAQDANDEFEGTFFDAVEGRDKTFIRSLPNYMLERETRLRAPRSEEQREAATSPVADSPAGVS